MPLTIFRRHFESGNCTGIAQRGGCDLMSEIVRRSLPVTLRRIGSGRALKNEGSRECAGNLRECGRINRIISGIFLCKASIFDQVNSGLGFGIFIGIAILILCIADYNCLGKIVIGIFCITGRRRYLIQGIGTIRQVVVCALTGIVGSKCCMFDTTTINPGNNLSILVFQLELGTGADRLIVLVMLGNADLTFAFLVRKGNSPGIAPFRSKGNPISFRSCLRSAGFLCNNTLEMHLIGVCRVNRFLNDIVSGEKIIGLGEIGDANALGVCILRICAIVICVNLELTSVSCGHRVCDITETAVIRVDHAVVQGLQLFDNVDFCRLFVVQRSFRIRVIRVILDNRSIRFPSICQNCREISLVVCYQFAGRSLIELACQAGNIIDCCNSIGCVERCCGVGSLVAILIQNRNAFIQSELRVFTSTPDDEILPKKINRGLRVGVVKRNRLGLSTRFLDNNCFGIEIKGIVLVVEELAQYILEGQTGQFICALTGVLVTIGLEDGMSLRILARHKTDVNLPLIGNRVRSLVDNGFIALVLVDTPDIGCNGGNVLHPRSGSLGIAFDNVLGIRKFTALVDDVERRCEGNTFSKIITVDRIRRPVIPDENLQIKAFGRNRIAAASFR